MGQPVTLFDDSVFSNVAIGNTNASKSDVLKALEIAHCMDFVEKLPDGIDTVIGPNGSNLSGGQRQRLALARAFYRNASVLVLDEATSALDVDTEQQVTRNLAEVYRGSTVLFITHRLGSLRHADRILVMHQGSLVEQGSHSELMKLGGRYATLYRQQEAGQS